MWKSKIITIIRYVLSGENKTWMTSKWPFHNRMQPSHVAGSGMLLMLCRILNKYRNINVQDDIGGKVQMVL